MAQEGELCESAAAVVGTHVEGLAPCLGVSVVAPLRLAFAAEGSGRNLGQDRIVLARHAGHVHAQHVDVGHDLAAAVAGAVAEIVLEVVFLEL